MEVSPRLIRNMIGIGDTLPLHSAHVRSSDDGGGEDAGDFHGSVGITSKCRVREMLVQMMRVVFSLVTRSYSSLIHEYDIILYVGI